MIVIPSVTSFSILLLLSAPSVPQSTELISRSSMGGSQNGDVTTISSSADGRWIAYTCDGSDVLPGDSNNSSDVFLYDRVARTTRLVSHTPSYAFPNDDSYVGTFSADGRFLAYSSTATNILPGMSGSRQRIYLYDTLLGTTSLVDRNSRGEEANGSSGSPILSPTGRWLAFSSNATNLDPRATLSTSELFLRDLQTGMTELISVAYNGHYGIGFGGAPNCLSRDGRYVMFGHYSADLVPGDTNGQRDLFVRDMRLGKTRRVNVGWNGSQTMGAASYAGSPSMSWDGRRIVFASEMDNLVPGDTNGLWDVFERDLAFDTIRRISIGPGGVPNGASELPILSGRGHFIAFRSAASNLGPPDSNGRRDIFLWFAATSIIEKISLDGGGGELNYDSMLVQVSESGEFAYFTSETGATTQLFLRTLGHPDFDADGLPDRLEPSLGTLSNDVDSDEDGLGDADEFFPRLTDPAHLDSDSDGVQDGTEAGITTGLVGNPGNGVAGTDTGIFQPDLDPATTTDPLDGDTDDDGLSDGAEDLDRDGRQGVLETASDRFDSDEDGLGDGQESGLSHGLPDTDPGVFVPDVDPGSQTDPLLSDTDGGGTEDGVEDHDLDGGYSLGESNPNDAQDDHFDLFLTNFVRGQTCTVRCERAKPGAWVTTAASKTGAGPTVVNGITVALSPPILAFDALFADPSGTAAFAFSVPRGLPAGTTTYWHAVEVFAQSIVRTSHPVTAIVP